MNARAARFGFVAAAVAGVVASAPARAQVGAPAAAVPAAGAPPVPATPPISTSGWGGRVGAAEVTVVGGNVASARERALTEALKQAVDQTLVTAFPEAKAQQPKVVAQVLNRARTYVRRYRTLEEGERARGLYALKIEADVDEAALARVFDKPAGAVFAPGGAAPSVGVGYFVIGAGAPEALSAALRGFNAAGARIQQGPPELTDPAKAFEAAAKVGFSQVAFVSGSAIPEGKVRGPGLESAACTLSVRVMAAGSGLPVAEESDAARGFSERPEAARADCFQRAAASAIPRLVPAAGARVAADVRTIVVDADVVEPGAVPALVRHLRGIGSVSAVEVRRIAAGRVELWARSRMPASSLAAAIARDTGGSLAITEAQVSGDLVRIRARIREVAQPAPVSPPAPPPGAAIPPPPGEQAP